MDNLENSPVNSQAMSLVKSLVSLVKSLLSLVKSLVSLVKSLVKNLAKIPVNSPVKNQTGPRSVGCRGCRRVRP